MGRPRRTPFAFLIAFSLILAACESAPDDAVASVDGQHLTVDEAAQLLAPYEHFANVTESVRSLAELWIEFTVVGEAIAEDSLLSSVDVSRVQELQARRPVILALRDSVIDADTALTEEEVREAYLEENPGTRIRARHILIQVPPGATPADRDSLRITTSRIRARVERGQSFEEVARQYSQDPGSAAQGGDLGTFERGRMVPAFEEAAFALEVGELSEPVETEHGFHIIRVEERVDPPFEEVRSDVRAREQNRIQAEAETAFLENLEESMDFRVVDDAVERAQALATAPGAEPADPDEPLVEYEGGALTEREFREYLLLQSRAVAQQVRGSSVEQLEPLLQNLARQEIMLAEADRLGIEVAEEEAALPTEQIQQAAVSAAHTLGLVYGIETSEEGSTEAAVQETAFDVLDNILSGDAQIMEFGPAVGAIRLQRDTRVYPERFEQVVERVEEIRAAPEFEPFSREPAGPAGGAEPLDQSPTDAGTGTDAAN